MRKCHENFITDINDLCNECPIREKINRGRTNTIKECELIKSANTKEFYIDYLRNQITKANQVIERIAKRVIKLKEEAYKENESALFLSWKDCISYYNEQIEASTSNNGAKGDEVLNPYPVIFKNGDAYLMFLELKKLTVKQKTIVADYAFIYHSMKSETLKGINKVVTEPAFTKFLREDLSEDISVDKLPYKDPAYKQPLYQTTLDKYKSKILNESKKVQ